MNGLEAEDATGRVPQRGRSPFPETRRSPNAVKFKVLVGSLSSAGSILVLALEQTRAACDGFDGRDAGGKVGIQRRRDFGRIGGDSVPVSVMTSADATGAAAARRLTTKAGDDGRTVFMR